MNWNGKSLIPKNSVPCYKNPLENAVVAEGLEVLSLLLTCIASFENEKKVKYGNFMSVSQPSLVVSRSRPYHHDDNQDKRRRRETRCKAYLDRLNASLSPFWCRQTLRGIRFERSKHTKTITSLLNQSYKRNKKWVFLFWYTVIVGIFTQKL